MNSAVSAVILCFALVAGAAGCDGGKPRCTASDVSHDVALGKSCDHSATCDVCGSPGTCAIALCMADSTGLKCDSPPPYQGTCTKSCSSDGDCATLPATDVCSVVGGSVASMHWACVSGQCFGYYTCSFSSGCPDWCGGAFCTGVCTGCPGC
jgi:hypothetical protein